MIFFLGTHQTDWLSFARCPLFVSTRRLRARKKLTTAAGPWALDSGGFSELAMYGEWRTTPQTYLDEIKRYAEHIGGLVWAAPQDYMCEPFMLARTGLTVKHHQARTIDSYLYLNSAQDEVSVIPVLQGYTVEEYLDHADQYARRGVNLEECSTVGLGSVCRRQAMVEAEEIVRSVNGLGLQIHAFGFKLAGIAACHEMLSSSDSMAWSKDARTQLPLPQCSHGRYGNGNCANCFEFALLWRRKVLALLGE